MCVGIEQPGRIGGVQHPLADRAGITVFIPREGDQRHGGQERIHREGVSLNVAARIRADEPHQAVNLLPAPSALDHDLVGPGIAAIKDPVDHLVDIEVSALFGVHAGGGVSPERDQDLVVGVCLEVVVIFEAPVDGVEVVLRPQGIGRFVPEIRRVLEPSHPQSHVGLAPDAVETGCWV